MDFYHRYWAFAMLLYDCGGVIGTVSRALLPAVPDQEDGAGFAAAAKAADLCADYDWLCAVPFGISDYGRRDPERNVPAGLVSGICRRSILFWPGDRGFCDIADGAGSAFFGFSVAGEERGAKNPERRRPADDGMFCDTTGGFGVWLLWEGI